MILPSIMHEREELVTPNRAKISEVVSQNDERMMIQK
jgi:hypothetical protein